MYLLQDHESIKNFKNIPIEGGNVTSLNMLDHNSRLQNIFLPSTFIPDHTLI